MYDIEFLPLAKSDIENIIYYIKYNLNNSTAALNLNNNFIKAINNITYFPYGAFIYKQNKLLTYEYRSVRVKNFLIFYTINESKKLITIVRVLYQSMNINNILE